MTTLFGFVCWIATASSAWLPGSLLTSMFVGTLGAAGRPEAEPALGRERPTEKAPERTVRRRRAGTDSSSRERRASSRPPIVQCPPRPRYSNGRYRSSSYGVTYAL